MILHKPVMIPVQIVKMAKHLGFEAFLSDYGKLPNLTGAVILDPDLKSMVGTDKVIFIRNKTSDSLEQQRLNIALAIAQYQLDFDPAKYTQYWKPFDTRTMNYTDTSPVLSRALKLLLPEKAFLIRYKKLKKQAVPRYTMISTLVEDFAVGCDGIMYRLRELNLDF